MDYLKAISLDELEKAANECARGVRWKQSIAAWMFNKAHHLVALHDELVSGKYKLGKYIVFSICDPKPRIIHSTRFRDRVFQRSLCNNGLYDALTKPLIYDCGACMKGKGTLFTFKRVTAHLHKYFNKNKTNEGFYMKLDIKKYFDSTPHALLKEVVKKHVKDQDFIRHVFDIIDSFADMRSGDKTYAKKMKAAIGDRFGVRGIGLGSQISQLLQLLYLSELDHMLKEKLHIKHYVRYMDDMIILDKSKSRLEFIRSEVEDYLERIGLQLNPKSRIGRIADGVQFMKVTYKLTCSGKIKIRISRSSISRELKRITTLMKKLCHYDLQAIDIIQHFNTWIGSNLHKLNKRQLKAIFKHLKQQFEKHVDDATQI